MSKRNLNTNADTLDDTRTKEIRRVFATSGSDEHSTVAGGQKTGIDLSRNDALNASAVKRKCYRISQVPLNWEKAKLLSVIQSEVPPLKHIDERQVHLFPSGTGGSRTALINVTPPLELFDQGQQRDTQTVRLGTHQLEIDCHFYGMTPLNDAQEVIAE